MKIYLEGEETRKQEFRELLQARATWIESPAAKGEAELLVFLNYDDPGRSDPGLLTPGKPNIICSVKKTLREMLSPQEPVLQDWVMGMNLLPTFIHRPLQEVCFLSGHARTLFEGLASRLGWKLTVVQDHTGMVTPRVLSMIVNEACLTLQHKIATIPDIDQAMKLGTAYPMGPLEWCDRIGITQVYEILKALQRETGDPRYQLTPLLEEMALQHKLFYPTNP